MGNFWLLPNSASAADIAPTFATAFFTFWPFILLLIAVIAAGTGYQIYRRSLTLKKLESIASLAFPVWVTDTNHALIIANNAAKNLLDLTGSTNKPGYINEPPKHRCTIERNETDRQVDSAKNQSEYWSFTSDDRQLTYEVNKQPAESVLQKSNWAIHVAQNISDLKTSERELKNKNLIIKAALGSSKIGIWDWQLDGDVWYATPSYWTCLGYEPIEGPGDRQKELTRVHPDDRAMVAAKIEAVISGESEDSYAYEARVLHADGQYRWVNVRCTVVETDPNGKPSRLMGARINIDDEKRAQEKAHWLEQHDFLTSLPNRLAISSFFADSQQKRTKPDVKMAFIFIDLDRFKQVNDTLGHRAGDALLKIIAGRLNVEIDAMNFVARMGSDDFLIILTGSSKTEAMAKAKTLQRKISTPSHIVTNEMAITACMGISAYPEDGLDFDELYKCADIALTNAKAQGTNQISIYNENMRLNYRRSSDIEMEMHRALRAGEFDVYFQPQISIESNQVIGVEALLRWNSKTLGVVSPAEFIPVAEKTGLIIPLGEWVLKTAISKVQSWPQSNHGNLKLSVNISPVQFRRQDLITSVQTVLAQTDFPPEFLEIELTESATMDNVETAVEVMEKIHQLGVSMSIDDFGTGYSSLSYLKTLPIYKLKIDRSFVADMINDPNDRAIVKAIIAMARSLGLYTIAEGVETKQQLDLLVELGCEEAQGFYFSRPLPEAEIVEFLNNHTTIKIAAN